MHTLVSRVVLWGVRRASDMKYLVDIICIKYQVPGSCLWCALCCFLLLLGLPSDNVELSRWYIETSLKQEFSLYEGNLYTKSSIISTWAHLPSVSTYFISSTILYVYICCFCSLLHIHLNMICTRYFQSWLFLVVTAVYTKYFVRRHVKEERKMRCASRV